MLASPPNVPPAIHRNHPAKVIVELEIREIQKEISEGVQYTFWTFGGTVPGSFIRVREGDTVEFHLKNHPDNKMPHNIDLHGVVGPGGGAASSFTARAMSRSSRSRLFTEASMFITAPLTGGYAHRQRDVWIDVGRTPGGLTPVDHEYYVMREISIRSESIARRGSGV